MQTTKIAAIVVVALVVAGCGAAAFAINNGKSSGVTEDFAGYEVKTVDNLNNGIVAVGQDSFRWVTYFGLADKCVMVDINDKANYMAKAFMYVGKTQALNANTAAGKTLKFTSTNCGITDADAATIIDLNPSVVVVPVGFEETYKKQMDSLRAANLHVVHIGYIYTFLNQNTFELTDDTVKQIDILAKTFDKQDRANELKDAFSTIVNDIRSIASTVKDSEKKNAYIGCLAYNGAHGTESSIAYYMPFALANIDNVMKDEKMDFEGSGVDTYSATKISEKIDDNTVLLLDATGIYAATDSTSFGILKLFAGHEAYIAYPYIWTGINYEDVLISAYQLLHDVYGKLTDEQLAQKISDVHTKFLGTNNSNRSETAATLEPPTGTTTIYDDMSNMYQKRRGNPTHGAISINSDGKITYS